MTGFELLQELAHMRQIMFMEGSLNEAFLVLEYLEEDQPNFVESIIRTYLPSSADYIQKQQGILETVPLNLTELRRLTMKLRGSSASIGAAKLTTAVDEMLTVVCGDETNTNRIGAALGKVRFQHVALKTHLDIYTEMLAKLRGDNPLDPEVDDNEYAESSASNNVSV